VAGYSNTPDYNSGVFFGPTAFAAGGFPAGVYLSAGDYAAWQAAATAINQAQANAVAQVAASGGTGDQAAAASAKAASDLLAAQNAAAAAAAAATAAAPVAPPAATASPAQPSPSPGAAAPAGGREITPPRSASATPLAGAFVGESYCDLYPDDPLCLDWGPGEPISIGGGGSTTTTIVEPGLSATDITSAIQGGLSALWAAGVTAIDAVLLSTIRDIQSAITKLGNALLGAWQILSRLAGFILTFLRHMFEEIVRGIVAALVDVAKALKAIANDVLVPLVKAAQAIRQKIIDLYQRFLRPVLIIIQDIRRMLALLKLFHIRFAQKLDADLAALEAKITAPLFFLLKYTNMVANWMNLIVTAGYLIQRPLFLNSLNAYKGSAINLQLNAMTGPVDPAALAAANAANAPPTPAQSSADFTTYLQTGGGANAAPIAQNTDLFQQILQQGF
jgi:hypothetical protein